MTKTQIGEWLKKCKGSSITETITWKCDETRNKNLVNFIPKKSPAKLLFGNNQRYSEK